jgi:hypothetical protein
MGNAGVELAFSRAGKILYTPSYAMVAPTGFGAEGRLALD